MNIVEAIQACGLSLAEAGVSGKIGLRLPSEVVAAMAYEVACLTRFPPRTMKRPAGKLFTPIGLEVMTVAGVITVRSA